MTQYFQRVLFTIFMLLAGTTCSVTAHAGEGTPFNKIVIFGDSLSDNGNFYSTNFGVLPKSPPYFKGRFSNSYIWADNTANYFVKKNKVSIANYAVGGETAVMRNPFKGFLPYSLTASINNYLLRTLFSTRENTLYIIWIGANDYLNGNDKVDKTTSSVVDNIQSNIDRLIYHGGKNFIIANLPNISLSPRSKENHTEENLLALTTAHNKKLAAAVAQLENSYKQINIRIFDINSLFDDAVNHMDVYNKKYNKHIINTTEPCWGGGYTFTAIKSNEMTREQVIKQQLENQLHNQTLTKSTPQQMSGRFDTDILSHLIATTPDLEEAFNVTNQALEGEKTCKNADEYVFWDHLHPSAAMHDILSREITLYIEKYYLEDEADE